jgi:hypothetical protein
MLTAVFFGINASPMLYHISIILTADFFSREYLLSSFLEIISIFQSSIFQGSIVI